MDQQILQYLYKNSPFAIFMTLLLCTLQASVVENGMNIVGIYFWFAGLLAVQIYRFADYWHFKQVKRGEVQSSRLRFRNFRTGILMSGLLLGMFPLLIVDSVTLTEMVFVAFVSAGITAAATGSIGLDFQSHTGFLAATLVPLVICFLQMEGEMPAVMGTMTFFYMLYLMVIAGRFRRQLIANLELTEETLESRRDSARRQLMSEMVARILGDYLETGFSVRLLERITHEIVKLSGAHYGFLVEIQKSGNSDELQVHARVLVNSGNLDLTQFDQPLPIGKHSHLTPVLASQICALIEQKQEFFADQLEVYEANPRSMVLGSFCAVPLIQGGEVIGAVGLVDRHKVLSIATVDYLRPLLNTLEKLLRRKLRDPRGLHKPPPLTEIAV